MRVTMGLVPVRLHHAVGNLVKNAKAVGIIARDENEVMAVVESPEKRRRLLGDPAGGARRRVR